MTIVLLILAVAVVVSLFAFPGAAIFLIPLLVLAVALLGFGDFRRRRKQVQDVQHHRQEADSDGVDFTERDRRTLSH
jgi:uncharacterized membrane protein